MEETRENWTKYKQKENQMKHEGMSAAGGEETSEKTCNKGNLVEKICMERDCEQKKCQLYSCHFHP